MRRMSDGSEFQVDGHEIANDRDPKTVFEAGTQSSPDVVWPYYDSYSNYMLIFVVVIKAILIVINIC